MSPWVIKDQYVLHIPERLRYLFSRTSASLNQVTADPVNPPVPLHKAFAARRAEAVREQTPRLVLNLPSSPATQQIINTQTELELGLLTMTTLT